jgi:CDGSH-type Zn-finger protein
MADETRIIVRPNGPYLVEGPLTVVDIEGREYKSDRPRIALCRCGNSANKPFCDGTHQRIGFDAPSVAPGD